MALHGCNEKLSSKVKIVRNVFIGLKTDYWSAKKTPLPTLTRFQAANYISALAMQRMAFHSIEGSGEKVSFSIKSHILFPDKVKFVIVACVYVVVTS